MKNTCLKSALLLFSICVTNLTISQNLASTWYSASTSSVTYSSISGGTVLGSNSNNDDTFNAIPIGFTFNFLGNNYTDVSINANGYLKFGSVLNAYSASPIDDPFGDDSLVCALGTDLESNAAGTLRYDVTGTSPNRVFTLQWSNYTSLGGTDNLNFQIQLYETTNVIDMIYGSFNPISQDCYPEVGLRGNGILDFKNQSVNFGTNTWATPIAGINNYDYCEVLQGPPIFRPASGRKYTWTPPPLCTGTPTAGTTNCLTGTIACVGQVLNLNATGATFASGLTYQWQSSANGTTWTAVTSATNMAYAPTYTAAPIYYRRIIACGSNTAVSSAINFSTIAGNTYTSVPFLENFNATWQNRCGLRNIPRSTCWSSNPVDGNSSWRRQDDGVSANWTNLGNGISPLQGAGCADFNSDDATSGVSGSLDLYVNMGTTLNYDVSFYYSNDYGDDSLEVFLSTNGGGTFVKQANYKSGSYTPFLSGWNKNTISLLSVNSSSCVLRFQATSNSDYEHIAIDSLKIVTQPACTGTPSAGTLSSPIGSVVCLGQSLNLPISGGTTGFSNLTYQWQSSTNGSIWTAIPSATIPAYSPTYTTPLHYRRVVACGSNTAASNGLNFSTVAGITYTSVPYLENFNATWQNRCDLRNVPRTTCWSSNPTTGNNSWRRQDDGVSANWTNLGNGPTPLQGAGCANFNTDDATSGVSGSLDLYVNMGTTQNYDVSFYYHNDGGEDSLEVLLSTNGGSTFVKQATYKSGDYTSLSDWNKNTISLLSVNSPSCVVRFQATSNGDYDHIAIDSLRIRTQPNCTGTPSAGTLSSPIGSVICLGTTLNLPISGGPSGFSGLTYQWQSSTNGTTWTAVSSATLPTYSPLYTTPLYYRRIIACGVNSATTNALSFTTTIPISYAPVPFLENFDNIWEDRCDIRNVPTTLFWSSNPTSTDSSWRRQDDGISANWQNDNTGIVTPLTGLGAANFHSYDSQSGTSGSLDLHINMGTPQNYEVCFYHTNLDGGDSLEVFLSTNGGGTFTKKGVFFSGDINSIEINWNKKLINLTAINSPSCVLRFKATSDYGASDIGVDSLKIRTSAPPCVTPTLALSASSNSICSGGSSSLTVGGATSYIWSTSATTSVIAVSPTVITIYTVTGSNSVGCTSTRTIQISVNMSPTLTANNATICSGSPTVITASGASTYTWNPGSFIGSSYSVNPSSTTTYTVVGVDINGCLDTQINTVTVDQLPTTALAGTSQTLCATSTTLNGNVQTTGTGVWSLVSGTGTITSPNQANSTVTGLSIGNNVLQWTISNGVCFPSSSTISIGVNISPTVTANSNASVICAGSAATLTASGATTYSWSSGELTANIVVSPSTTTIYSLVGDFGLACPSLTTITQSVDLCLSVNGINSGSYNISVYPNPFSEDLTVTTNEVVRVQFFNTIGQQVIEKSINKTDVIDTRGFAKGIYHAVITGSSSTKTFKVIKE